MRENLTYGIDGGLLDKLGEAWSLPYERHEALCLLWDDVSRFGCSSKYRRWKPETAVASLSGGFQQVARYLPGQLPVRPEA